MAPRRAFVRNAAQRCADEAELIGGSNVAKSIPLTQGQVALVDDEDYERVMQHKWYAHRTTKRAAYYAKRTVSTERGRQDLALACFILNVPRGTPVDHINRNTLDNQRTNLRLASPAVQSHNRKKRRGSVSQYVGVSPAPNSARWLAQIQHNGQKRYLGVFVREEDAARAYDKAAREIYGADAFQNFPQEDDNG